MQNSEVLFQVISRYDKHIRAIFLSDYLFPLETFDVLFISDAIIKVTYFQN